MDLPIASQKHCCKRNRRGSSLNDSSNICWDPLQCVTCGLRDGQERHNLSLHDRSPKPPGPKLFNYSCNEWIDHNLNVKLRLTLKEGTNLKSLFFFQPSIWIYFLASKFEEWFGSETFKNMFCVPIHVCNFLQAPSLRSRKFTFIEYWLSDELDPFRPTIQDVCHCVPLAKEKTEAWRDEIICFKSADSVLATAFS